MNRWDGMQETDALAASTAPANAGLRGRVAASETHLSTLWRVVPAEATNTHFIPAPLAHHTRNWPLKKGTEQAPPSMVPDRGAVCRRLEHEGTPINRRERPERKADLSGEPETYPGDGRGFKHHFSAAIGGTQQVNGSAHEKRPHHGL
ncbi:MAG: hypothetical protein HZA24_12550 [Nitrospirae bacterium]|nr:hypothetical protein [Nitrospirota bacterium]